MSDNPIILDGFQLLNCIATGNDTQVWEVVNEGGGQRFAMKLMLPEAFKVSAKKQVLKREGKAGKLFAHPNLVKVNEIVFTKKHAYLIMDYFRSVNLKVQIHNDLYSVHLRMTRLLEQICLALAYIHERGWLHRDIKPDNILFNRGSELRLIDFSLASKGLKQRNKIQGTKSYIAPETLLKKHITPQTDMYSLGVTLYLTLTGEFPITGISPNDLLKNHLRVTPPNPSELNTNVAPEMDNFVMTLLEKSPKKRFRSMSEAYSLARNLKIFKEDVEVVEARRKEMEEIELRDGVDAARRLDSRYDAKRSKLLGKEKGAGESKRANQRPTKPATKKSEPVIPKPQQTPVTQTPQQPPAPVPVPVPVQSQAYAPPTGYGMPPMPGAFPPGTIPPGTIPPGTIPPGSIPPGSVPQQPMYPPAPPQGYPTPQAGYPSPPVSVGQPSIPQPQPNGPQPVPQPNGIQPPASQPSPPVKATAKVKPPDEVQPTEIDVDEIPLMDELPPVI